MVDTFCWASPRITSNNIHKVIIITIVIILSLIKLASQSDEVSSAHTLLDPQNRWSRYFHSRQVTLFFGFKTPVSSFHRNEQGSVSNTESRCNVTSLPLSERRLYSIMMCGVLCGDGSSPPSCLIRWSGLRRKSLICLRSVFSVNVGGDFPPVCTVSPLMVRNWVSVCAVLS